MGRRIPSRFALFFLINALCGASAFAQKLNETELMHKLKDDQLVAVLSSRDANRAHEAVEEVIRRGERMLPLLSSCKGNSSFFYGYGLGNRSSSFLIPLPSSDKTSNDGSYVTVEVAALYLISAIYHESLDFADAPYLTDGSPVRWQKFNTPERIKEAWHATEEWMQAWRKEGLGSLRSKHKSPLAHSKVHFWASR